MRKLCPNIDRKYGLETVLEVPMPEEWFCSDKYNNGAWQRAKSLFPRSLPETSNLTALLGGCCAEIQMFLGVAGAPLIPLPVCLDHPDDDLHYPISNEASMAMYIVKQYVGASGGEKTLDTVENMYAMGKMKMGVTEFCVGAINKGRRRKKKETARMKNINGDGEEMGGFVLWKKGTELWSLGQVLSGYKISAGCDGNVAWRQTPWRTHSHASNGASWPLRWFLQGLDPKTTAALFRRSVYVGERTINGEECFVLKLETKPSSLKGKGMNNIDTAMHTMWGCFSQRTGLLVQLEEIHLVRIVSQDEAVFWETRMETQIQDYRRVDGVQIAHTGKSRVTLFKLDESSKRHSKTALEEAWEIEEVGFNVEGLSSDCFLPPGYLQTKAEDVRRAQDKFPSHLPRTTKKIRNLEPFFI